MLQDQEAHAAEMEPTFIAIQPDGVQRGLVSEIIARFERKGFKLVAIKLVVPSKGFAEKHYHDLKERPFFNGLLAMVWEGEGVIKYGRKLIGATDPQKSEPGTIRGDLAVVVGRVHLGYFRRFKGNFVTTECRFIQILEQILLSSLKTLKSKKKPVVILDDIRGIIKPGRLTLLLGPPGAGKSTLLLALSGKLGKDLKVSGNVTYNGHTMREFVPQRTSAYISQHDLHNGDMTVRETLDFSARCQGVGHRLDVLAELARREKLQQIKPDPDIDFFMKAIAIQGQKSSIVSDYMLKLLGLEVCTDTMVGDNMRRGISGGQKKRVTTGEMIVGPSKAVFMDEISTGLDSSTTFQIVKCLKYIIHVLQYTSHLSPTTCTILLGKRVVLLA